MSLEPLFLAVILSFLQSSHSAAISSNSSEPQARGGAFVCGIPRIGSDDPFALFDTNVGRLKSFQDFAENDVGSKSFVETTIVGGQEAYLGEICWQVPI